VRGPWRARTAAGTASVAVVAMANPGGAAPRTARLPDGSSVTLAPGSALESAGGFGETHRDLRLTGEGAFTVAPGARPFRVRLQGTVVEDLSTAFLVRPDGDGAVVTVTEGAVVVGAPRDTLRQGVAAQVGADGAVHRLGADAVARETAWMRGLLVFADAPLGEVVARIARWSGRPVTVAPALAARRVTVTFAGERVDAMVQVLATTVGARAEAVGGGWRVVAAAR
jgi:transmembrane sensor